MWEVFITSLTISTLLMWYHIKHDHKEEGEQRLRGLSDKSKKDVGELKRWDDALNARLRKLEELHSGDITKKQDSSFSQ